MRGKRKGETYTWYSTLEFLKDIHFFQFFLGLRRRQRLRRLAGRAQGALQGQRVPGKENNLISQI